MTWWYIFCVRGYSSSMMHSSFCSCKTLAFSCYRTLDVQEKKHHIPVVDRSVAEPPPILVAVVGPPKVGKSTLVKCLVKNFARQKVTDIKGPITVVSGEHFFCCSFCVCNSSLCYSKLVKCWLYKVWCSKITIAFSVTELCSKSCLFRWQNKVINLVFINVGNQTVLEFTFNFVELAAIWDA